MRQLQFKMIPYFKKSSPDVGLRAELNQLFKKLIIEGNGLEVTKPVILFLTSETEFIANVGPLRAEGYKDIIHIHDQSKVSEIAASLSALTVRWKEVRNHHKNQQDSQPRVLGIVDRVPVAPRPDVAAVVSAGALQQYMSSPVTTTAGNLVISAPPEALTMPPSAPTQQRSIVKLSVPAETTRGSIDLIKFSISTHFRNLQAWRDDSLSGNTLLVGEDASGGPEDYAELSIEVDTKKKTQLLHVSCATPEALSIRLGRLNSMFERAMTERRVHKLLKWRGEHREAAMNSTPLAEMQRLYRATVVFHITSNVVLAEIVALHHNEHFNLYRALEALELRDDIWEIPGTALPHEVREQRLNAVRVKYAIKVERGNKTMKKGALHVFGFTPWIDEARKFVFKDVVDETSANDTLDHMTDRMVVTTKGVTGFKRYSFRERDVMAFLHAFLPEFKEYLGSALGLNVTVDGIPDRSAGEVNFDTLANVDVELRGPLESLNAGYSFLDSVNKTFRRVQVFFPRVSQEKYKKLLELKVRLLSYADITWYKCYILLLLRRG